MTVDQLKESVAEGTIDTVLVCMVDMQGRLVGKRFHAQYFVESGFAETHGCNYLLADDMENEPVPGYAATNWTQGYGDFVMQPDMTTLRPVPWLEGTVMVLCDVLDHHTHEPVPHSPRTILKKQIARLEAIGVQAMFASELEFYLFNESYDTAREKGYRNLETAGHYIEDYHIFQTTREENVMRAIRNGLNAAGIPVENSKGEWGPGQEEINIRYAEALEMADRHTVLKNGCKEIASLQGKSLSFMAKWDYDLAGNSSHVHQSLWSKDGKEALFLDKNKPLGMSDMMCHYMAGQLACASEMTLFLAPYINSYKRFQSGTFAPTKTMWSIDNRTAGFRLVGENTSGIRTECRIGGADLNPYLAFAALIAAGIEGIENKLDLEPPYKGNAYEDENLRTIPKTLREAIEATNTSSVLRKAFGDDVIEHYVHAAKWEQSEYDRRITDWEIKRGFERG
ncbi:glutamine synthetase family protein [Rubellicoccus peritrichatus]|uniref:Glutamine synthetase family protein n=1 Tax=Rubellicoccus peritrichatus TaxID=3080537 RepID=A0AAQ3QVU0_9BACT|nr:glutamine synthetase family protein [Puniceicoccus sp. CR14]WOO41207.1 glutamine synthetase family protein [Puniceicoccus sp. CR14]